MANRVSAVDDDSSTYKLLERVMHSNSLETTVTDNGQATLYLLKDHIYDITLMDVMPGDMGGFEVIRVLWSQDIKIPVMIVSGRNKDYNSLRGLPIGTDNYTTRPFRPLVLDVKVKALIRRSRSLSSNSSNQLERGPFSYNISTIRLYKDDGEIFLSSRKNNLMLPFMKHPGQVFTKKMVYEHVWGNTIVVDNNVVTVYINRLRSKIGEDRQRLAHIMTVWGLGYRLVP